MSNIARIGVIGAGTMGNGIAQICAVAGLAVTMVDINDAAVQRGLKTVGDSLERLAVDQALGGDRRARGVIRHVRYGNDAGHGGASGRGRYHGAPFRQPSRSGHERAHPAGIPCLDP